MGTPRETLRLVRDGDGPVRMVTTRTGVDHTAAMERWSRRRLEALAGEDLSGYVLKKDSPSCGMERVKVFGSGGMPQPQRPRHLRGGVARAVSQPAGRGGGAALRSGPARELHRAGLRLSASAQVLRAALDRRRPCRISHGTQDDAAVALDRELPAARPARRRGRANAARGAPIRLRELFMSTLRIPATTRRHTNVLMHMAGHLKKLARSGVQSGARRDHRRIPPGAGAVDRAADTAPAPRSRPRHQLICRGRPISNHILAS